MNGRNFHAQQVQLSVTRGATPVASLAASPTPGIRRSPREKWGYFASRALQLRFGLLSVLSVMGALLLATLFTLSSITVTKASSYVATSSGAFASLTIPGVGVDGVGAVGTYACEPVRWASPIGVTIHDNSIEKTGGADQKWDAGAISSQTYYAGDVSVDVLADNEGARIAFGLSHDNPDAGLDKIDYALVTAFGELQVYENGTYRGTFGRYLAGARLRVSLEAGVVSYYRNNLRVYTSSQIPEYPIFVDTSIYTVGDYVSDAYVCGNPMPPTHTPTPSPTPSHTPTPTFSATASATATSRSTSTLIPTSTSISTSVATATSTSIRTATATTTPTTTTTPSTPTATPNWCDPQPSPRSLVGDDGGADGSPLSYLDPSGGTEQAAVWLAGFRVERGFRLERVSIMWPSPQQARGMLAGRTVRILAYHDPQGRGTPVGATLLFDTPLPLTIADGATFQDFYMSVDVPSAGDLYVGYEDAWAEGGFTPAMYPALVDRTASQHHSWVVGNGTLPPDRERLGSNRDVIPLDSADPGNWMIRASGSVQATGTCTPQPTQTRPPAPTPIPGCDPHFSDVAPGDWFYTYVRDLACMGVVGGYADGTFRPGNGTTRGQLAKMVVRAFNLPLHTDGGPHFSDVPADNTFYGYVETVRYFGVVGGYADGTFRPNGAVTRGQLSKMVVLAAAQADPAGWPLQLPVAARFVDVPYGTTFYPYVETAASHGILVGYPCGGEGEPCPGAYFRPQAGATRAQISKIVRLATDTP